MLRNIMSECVLEKRCTKVFFLLFMMMIISGVTDSKAVTGNKSSILSGNAGSIVVIVTGIATGLVTTVLLICLLVAYRKRVIQALFLCALFLSKTENGHLFSSSLPRLHKCHEPSRIFPRTEQTFVSSARSFGVIS